MTIKEYDTDSLFYDVIKNVMNLNQRVATREQIDQATWKIWGHCRRSSESLDSEKHCRLIRETIESAVVDVQARIEGLQDELSDAKKKAREARKESANHKAKLRDYKKKTQYTIGQIENKQIRDKNKHKAAIDKLNGQLRQMKVANRLNKQPVVEHKPIMEEEFDATLKRQLREKVTNAIKEMKSGEYKRKKCESENLGEGSSSRGNGVAGERASVPSGRVLEGSDTGDREAEGASGETTQTDQEGITGILGG